MAIEIEKFVPAPKNLRFAGEVADLIAAGPDVIGKITVPSGEKVAAAKLAFQNAAKDAERSARVKLEETLKDGSTVLGFVLFDKRKPRGSGENAQESAKVETEAAEAVEKD